MSVVRCHVGVLGSGFAGTLLARILKRQGLDVTVMDRQRHPRFAIGESSTPIADAVLRDVAERYGMTDLVPLTRYGTARQQYPSLGIGLKRGFSYFRHSPGEPFEPGRDNHNQLLVAASASDDRSDTHWYRADVDRFFADAAAADGVNLVEAFEVDRIERDSPWRIEGQVDDGRRMIVRADILVDATGPGAVVARDQRRKVSSRGFRTNSRAVYGHFAGLPGWSSELERRGLRSDDHPFRCDAAAVHHVVEEGWFWQLGFDNGITSVGLVMDDSDPDRSGPLTSQRFWKVAGRYPSVDDQIRRARQVYPQGEMLVSRRLQFRVERPFGDDWVSLPSSIGFVDPLHSTGIAQSLCGVERLARMFEKAVTPGDRVAGWAAYAETVHRELDLIDLLVHTCYATRHTFRLFVVACMLYFAAAVNHERRRCQPTGRETSALLIADDGRFVTLARELAEDLVRASRHPIPESEIGDLEASAARRLAPFNPVGLLDPAARNMYRHTVAPNFD